MDEVDQLKKHAGIPKSKIHMLAKELTALADYIDTVPDEELGSWIAPDIKEILEKYV